MCLVATSKERRPIGQASGSQNRISVRDQSRQFGDPLLCLIRVQIGMKDRGKLSLPRG